MHSFITSPYISSSGWSLTVSDFLILFLTHGNKSSCSLKKLRVSPGWTSTSDSGFLIWLQKQSFLSIRRVKLHVFVPKHHMRTTQFKAFSGQMNASRYVESLYVKRQEYNRLIHWATLSPVNGNYAPKTYLPLNAIKQQKQKTTINQDQIKILEQELWIRWGRCVDIVWLLLCEWKHVKHATFVGWHHSDAPISWGRTTTTWLWELIPAVFQQPLDVKADRAKGVTKETSIYIRFIYFFHLLFIKIRPMWVFKMSLKRQSLMLLECFVTYFCCSKLQLQTEPWTHNRGRYWTMASVSGSISTLNAMIKEPKNGCN